MFADRVNAGRRLADRLQRLRGQDGVVLGLARGGVPVALEVAQALDAPLEVIVVRKLGVPPERAELERRARRFRGDRPRVALAGKTAVVVDDGIATGSTAGRPPGRPGPRCEPGGPGGASGAARLDCPLPGRRR
jgi:putative phosphoribosyl transferase